MSGSVDLGSAHGSITIDASGANKGVRDTVAALRELETHTAQSARAMGQLDQSAAIQRSRKEASQLNALIGEVAGRFTLAAVAFKAVDFGKAALFDYNSAVERSRTTLIALTGSQAQAAAAMALARKEADAGRGQFLELTTAIGGLVPASKSSGESLQELTRLSQILAALNPAEGLQGAAFALRELASGDVTSVVERFNIPRKALQDLRASGVGDVEALRRVLQGMGVDFSLVEKQSQTAGAQAQQTAGRFKQMAGEALSPAYAQMGRDLRELNKELANLGKSGVPEELRHIVEGVTAVARSWNALTGVLTPKTLMTIGGLVADAAVFAEKGMLQLASGFFTFLNGQIDALKQGAKDLAVFIADATGNQALSQAARAIPVPQSHLGQEFLEGFQKDIAAFEEQNRATWRKYVTGPAAEELSGNASGSPVAPSAMNAAAAKVTAAYLQGIAGADLGKVESLAGVIAGLLGQGGEARGLELASRVVADLGQSNQLTAETTKALTDALGNQAPVVLSLVAAYGRAETASVALKTAQASIEAAQATLADAQARRDQEVAPLQARVEAIQRAADAHAEQAQARIGAMRDEMAGVQREAEDAGRAWDALLRGMNADLKALQETAKGNAAAFQAQVDAAQGQLQQIQRQADANAQAFQQQVEREQAGLQGLQRQAEANAATSRAALEAGRADVEAARTAAQQHAGVVQAILRGETQEWAQQQREIDDTTRRIIARYDAEVRGLLNARNAARDEVDAIEAERTARLLAIDEQIAAARRLGVAGNATIRRLARERERAEKGTPAQQDAERVARGRAALADRELTQAERRIQSETAGIRATDAERQKATDANLAAIQRTADSQAAADKAAIDAQQRRIQGIQEAAKTQAEADRAAIEAQQAEIARIQDAAKLQAAADQAAIDAQQTRIEGVQEQQLAERERYDARIRQMGDELAAEQRRADVVAKADAQAIKDAQARLDAAETYWKGEIASAQQRVDAAQKVRDIAQEQLDKETANTKTIEDRIKLIEDAIKRGIPLSPGTEGSPPMGVNFGGQGAGGGGTTTFTPPPPPPPEPPPQTGPTAFNRFAPSLSAFQQPAMSLAPPPPVTVQVDNHFHGGVIIDNEARLRQLSDQIAGEAETRTVSGLLDAWDERGRGGFVYGRPV